MSERVKGTIYVLIAAVALSTAGLFVKLAVWDSTAITAGRSVATLAAGIVYLIISKHRFVINKAVIFGALCVSTMSQTFVVATQMTSAANAIVLQYTQPFFVILLLWIVFHEVPGKREILAVVIAFAGLICFFLDKLTPGGMTGNCIAIFSGFIYAVFVLIKKMKGNDYISSVLIASVINIVLYGWTIPRQTDFSPFGILMVVLFGIVPCFAGYLFLSAGLDRIPLVAGSLLTMLEPVLNPVWVALFYGEVMGRMSFVGMVILLGTAAVYSVMQARAEQVLQ